MRIDAVSLVNIGRRIRLPRGDIDAVMHDVDARRIYFRVRAEDVLAHSPGDGDDAVGVLVSGFFRKRAESVPALQLLGFPGAQWLEGVSRKHVRNRVELLCGEPGKVCVPGMGVYEVRTSAVLRHGEVDTEGLEGGVSAGEGFGDGIGLDADFATFLAETTYAYVDAASKNLAELIDVNAGASIDRGWVFLRQDVNAHYGTAYLGETSRAKRAGRCTCWLFALRIVMIVTRTKARMAGTFPRNES